jgi:hypothetical protein
MGGKATMPLIMAGVGIMAPYAAAAMGPALSGGALAASTTGGLTATTTGLSLGNTVLMSVANASALTTGMAGFALGNALGPEPQMPDYSTQFQGAQSFIDNQQSFTRRSTADLENSLEFGSEYEKNQAFDELNRRGEDASRLNEIKTRNDRTAENQEDIDRYITDNAPPSDEELEVLMANLASQEYRELEDDVDDRLTEVRQVQAARGLGSSNALSQLEARLAEIEQKGKQDIDQNVQDRVLSYQSGVSNLYNQGLNRLLQGAGYEDTASRYSIGLADQQRSLNQNLRNSRTATTSNLGLEKFRAEVQGLNDQYKADVKSRDNNALLGLGAAQLIGGGGGLFGSNNTTPTVPTTSNLYQSSSPSSSYGGYQPDPSKLYGGNYSSYV